MRNEIITTNHRTGLINNQAAHEVINAVVASGQTLDETDVGQLAAAITGIIHDDEKLYHDNEVVVL